MNTTNNKDNEASKPGRYSYMELLSEWGLNNRHFEWMDYAACAGADPGLFFAEKGWFAKYGEAKKMCAKCTVYKDCLKFALDNNIRHGVWGGLTPEERAQKKRDDRGG